jgi:hypothetical protein
MTPCALAAQLKIASYFNLGTNPALWRMWLATRGPIEKGESCEMATNLRIRFARLKKEIKSSWCPVIFQLRLRGSKKTSQYAVEDFERDIKDDPAQGNSYFEIRNLKKGTYEFKVMALQTGQPVIHKASLSLKDKGKDYFFGAPVAGRKEVNVSGKDVVADAPYRLQKSYPYLPLIVFMKDITPGRIHIKSIQISIFSQSAGSKYAAVIPGNFYEVIDSDGTRVEKNGRPVLLRFDEGEAYETVITDPWYRMIFLHKDQLEVTTGKHLIYRNARYLQYRVEVNYQHQALSPKSLQFTFRTLLSESDLPRVDDWYYGDNHYHSEFTDNPAEYGGPLPMTAKVAKAMGFSWVTVTDHSYCLSYPKTREEKDQGNRWLSYKKAVQKANETQKDVLLVGAEEITFSRPIIGLHLLSFGNPFVEDTSLAGFGSLTIEEVLQKITGNGTQGKGFLFAAHPTSGGYTWEDDYYDVATNPKWGNVFAGLQIFNEKILYQRTTTLPAGDEALEPFELLDEDSRQRPWSKELREGLKNHWIKRFLVPSLKEYRKSGNLRKYMILAGSDAHMDFNYSLRPKVPLFLQYLNDNAFGKVRSLVYLPKQDGQVLTESNLHEALRNGRTLLTDGPVVLFNLKIEGENRVYRFGETVFLSPGKNLELSLEWQSTPEFGPVQSIKLIQGTPRGEKNITDQIRLPALRKRENGLKGQLKHLFTNWTQSPCYLRLQASSMIDPQTGEGVFGCFTNPIWIVAQ